MISTCTFPLKGLLTFNFVLVIPKFVLYNFYVQTLSAGGELHTVIEKNETKQNRT